MAEYRKRLSSISWMMPSLNQHIAKRANAERNESGNSWNSRFDASRILDEVGILCCVIYIDLNQIRAGMAPTPEKSRCSSICDRLLGFTARSNPATYSDASEHDGFLSPLSHDGDGQDAYPVGLRASSKGAADMLLEQYFALLDWTGRQLHPGKFGVIDDRLPPILERIGLSKDGWLNCLRDFKRLFKTAVGLGDSMRTYAADKRWRCVHGSNLVDDACKAEPAS